MIHIAVLAAVGLISAHITVRQYLRGRRTGEPFGKPLSDDWSPK